MDSQITVADARIALQQYVRSASAFIGLLNQVCQRLILSGKWKGMVSKYAFNSSAGFISLPPYLLSVLNSTYNRWPTTIQGQQYEMFESGPGLLSETWGWLGVLSDMGDGFPTEGDIIKANDETSPAITAKPGTVRLYSTGSDNGKIVRLFGTQQESSQPVSDPTGVLGESITLNAPFVDSVNHYSELTDAEKETTKGPIAVWVIPTGGGANYQLGSWLPQETRPRRRRYKTGRAEKAIEVLCQRRFVPVAAETDFVLPGNLAALKFGLKALNYEDTGYADKAKAEWASAINWLNEEATASRGGALPSVPNVGGMGGYDGIPEQH